MVTGPAERACPYAPCRGLRAHPSPHLIEAPDIEAIRRDAEQQGQRQERDSIRQQVAHAADPFRSLVLQLLAERES